VWKISSKTKNIFFWSFCISIDSFWKAGQELPPFYWTKTIRSILKGLGKKGQKPKIFFFGVSVYQSIALGKLVKNYPPFMKSESLRNPILSFKEINKKDAFKRVKMRFFNVDALIFFFVEIFN
jgi:hypothetical protein